MKPKRTRDRHWIFFNNGCIHGVHCAQVVVVRSFPRERLCRDTISVFTVSKVFSLLATLAAAAALLLLLAGCRAARPPQGGAASSRFSGPGHTNAVTLMQSEYPKDPSHQTVQSEQTIEYVLPPGTTVPLGNMPSDTLGSSAGAPYPGLRKQIKDPARTESDALPNSEPLVLNPPAAVLSQPMPVKYRIRDRTETSIGAAQKDLAREWAAKASSVQPVMWAGIAMMTVVAGVLIYFGWWTKAALAVAVGLGMIGLAAAIPDHGTLIFIGGLAVFGLAALLVLYAYYKGQWDSPVET